jgi:hypothetical protein
LQGAGWQNAVTVTVIVASISVWNV